MNVSSLRTSEDHAARRRPAESFGPGAFVRIALLVLPLILGWRIICNAAADLLIDDPRAALSWDGDDPRALSALVRMELLAPEDAHSPMERAARLVSIDPLAFEALSLYGATLAREEKSARAEDVFRTAAKYSSLDLIAHGVLFMRSAEVGDYARAFREVDVMLRGRPQLGSGLYQYLRTLIRANAGAETELVRLLATQPPWRAELLAYLCGGPEQSDVLIRIFRQLRASGAPPSSIEMRAFLDRLVWDGRIQDAYVAWVRQLSQRRLADLGYLHNNRFQHPVSNLPFDWRFTPARGAEVNVVSSGAERLLRVQFFGARIAFAHVTHLLTLSPGTYSFSGSLQLSDIENARGLRWRIYCNDTKATLTATNLLVGTTPWTPFDAKFMVPPSGCVGQWLVLEIPARTATEAEVSGEARYKNLSIVAVDTKDDGL